MKQFVPIKNRKFELRFDKGHFKRTDANWQRVTSSDDSRVDFRRRQEEIPLMENE